MSPEPPPQARMLQMITAYWVSQAIGVAARLGVADQLGQGPRSAQEVAKAVGANPSALFRVMRMLASIGILRMDERAVFSLTPLGETLRSNAPGSVRDFAIAETAYGHRSLKPKGKLLLVEMLIPPHNVPGFAQTMDLNMLVMLTGRERTEAEFRALLEPAGFKLERVIPTHSPFYVIEASRG